MPGSAAIVRVAVSTWTADQSTDGRTALTADSSGTVKSSSFSVHKSTSGATVMSKAPEDVRATASDRATTSATSLLTRTPTNPSTRAFSREISLSQEWRVVAASMRAISSNAASIAARPASASGVSTVTDTMVPIKKR